MHKIVSQSTSAQSIPDAIDAGTLADRLLGDPLPNVDYLINRLSPPTRTERETPLLEFKASYLPQPGDPASVDACKWNVVEAIVSMANATGGCILLGVTETQDHLLAACGCDPHGVLEKPGKESKDLIGNTTKELFHKNGVYQIDDNRSFTLNDPTTIQKHVHLRLCHSEEMGSDVIAIIVSPVPEDNDLLTVKKTVSRNGEKSSVAVLFYRDDEFPRNNHIEDIAGRFTEYDSFRRNRRVTRQAYAELLRPETALREKICQSHKRLLARLDTFKWSSFIPLDAIGNETELQSIVVKKINVDTFFLPEFGVDGHNCIAESAIDGPPSEKSPVQAPRISPVELGQKPLDSVFKETYRFCLVGAPGSGKTTSIRHRARNWILSDHQLDDLIIYIPLGAWGTDGSLTGLASQMSGIAIGELEPLFSTGRAFIFLDGFNECPDNFKDNAELQIRNFIRDYPKCGLVVSSRHSKDICRLGLPIWELEPFDSHRQQRYLQARLGDIKKADALISRLSTQPGGDVFLQNPLLLQMLSDYLLDSPDTDIPSGRANLYRRCVNLWFSRELTKAVRADIPDAKNNLIYRIQQLQRLAFRSREEGFRNIPRTLIEEDTIKSGKEWDEDFDLPFAFIEKEGIRFCHETFQEYFCAEWLVRHPNCLGGLECPKYGTWGMPMAFAFELLSDIGDCPDWYFDIARKMNPWFHIAVLSGAGKPFPRPQTQTEEPTHEDLFRKAVSGELIADDFPYVFFLIRYTETYGFKGWYSKDDSPLEYILQSNSRSKSQWARFEQAIFGLVFGDESEYFVSEEVGKRLVSNFLAIKISDFISIKHNTISPLHSNFKTLLDNLPFPVFCTMLASGFAKKSDFPEEYLNRFSFIFNNPTLDEYLLLCSAGLATETQWKQNKARWILLERKDSNLDGLTHEQIQDKVRHGIIIPHRGLTLWELLHPKSYREKCEEACPSSKMIEICSQIRQGRNKPESTTALKDEPQKLQSRLHEDHPSLDSVWHLLCSRMRWHGDIRPKDVFLAWYGGILSWADLKRALDIVCTKEQATAMGHSFIDEEYWWSRIPSPISSMAALGASDLTLDLPVKKALFCEYLSHIVECAGSYYVARWLVPAGLARKEQFLPRVKDWVIRASEGDLVDLAIDGWIDIETVKQKTLDLDSQGKLTPSFRERLASSFPEIQELLGTPN